MVQHIDELPQSLDVKTMERSLLNIKFPFTHTQMGFLTDAVYEISTRVRELYKAQNNQQILNKATDRWNQTSLFAKGLEYSLLHNKGTRELQLI